MGFFLKSMSSWTPHHVPCLDVDCQHEDAGTKEGDAGGGHTVEEAEVQPDDGHDCEDEFGMDGNIIFIIL